MGFLSNKWVLQGLGLLALALLVWFAGPHVGLDGVPPLEPVWPRVVLIALIVLLFAAWHLARRAWAWRKDSELFQKLGEADPARDDSRRKAGEKLDALRGGFEASVQRLRTAQSQGKASRDCLYERPWYVIIGAPGTGKTTALINAGLKFFQDKGSKPQAVKGVGGTRNCDWWFADEAVLLDTAGRYVTQDSHREVDEQEWQGFLALLKEYRPKRPLNGILVASSLADLLGQTQEEKDRHAEALRHRVMELHRALGTRTPVYLLFTKLDLVAGFNEFFADFGSDERKQVWGETFAPADPEQPNAWLGEFAKAYDGLLARLEPHMYRAIWEKGDAQRRGLILGFPQQMAALKPAILDLLEAVFAANHYAKPAILLRGVYFTCGTQEGSPIDRLMGGYARAFGLERRAERLISGPGKSFFLNRLLKEVVFPEAELAGVDPRIERRERWLQWGVWGGALALTLLFTGLWWASFGLNRSAIADTEAQIQAFQTSIGQPADTRDNFRLLQAKLDALRGAGEVWRGTGWAAHFGLFQGGKLEPAADDAYHRTLGRYLLPAIALRLQERLQAGADIALLKAYRMLGKADWPRFDPEFVKPVVLADWEQSFNADPEVLASLRIHLDALLALQKAGKLEPVALDEAPKAQAVAQLTLANDAERCYASFKALQAADRSRDFKLAEALRPNGQKAFMVADGREIDIAVVPGLFTAEGYKAHVLGKSLEFAQGCTADNWALDKPDAAADPREVKRLHDQFMALYLGEYQNYWDQLLKGIKPRPPQALHQTVDLLDILSRPMDSPLRQLLVELEKNTSLGKTAADAAKLAEQTRLMPDEQTRDKLKAAKSLLGLGSGTDGDLVARLERSFAELNTLVRTGGGSAAPLDAVLKRLEELGNYFRQSSGGAAPQNAAGRIGGGDVVERARDEFGRLPEPVRTWLLGLTTAGSGEAMSNAKTQLVEKAKAAGVAGPASRCRAAAFPGRYPLARGGAEAAPTDFADFFKPGGLMNLFFLDNLANFIDTAASPWRQKASAEGQSLGLSADAIRQFQSADKIRRAFFPGGAASPQADFTVLKVELGGGADSFHLNNGGQDLVYRAQGLPPPLHWSSQAPGAGFSFETADHQQVPGPVKPGPWALLRLLEEAGAGPGRFSASFAVGGYSARLDMQAASVDNPFSLGEARSFHCLESL